MAATTTPVKQKAAAVNAAAKPKPAAKPAAAKKAPRDRSRWRDAGGQEIVKGVTVKADGKKVGTAAYRHTHEIEGKEVGMIGVALNGKGDAIKVGGRTAKNRSYRADELTVVVE